MSFPSTIKKIRIANTSFGTRELGPALYSAIRSSYKYPWNVELNDKLEQNRDDLLYIIICPAGIKGDLNAILPKYYIAWQLEDLQSGYDNPTYYGIMKKALAVWDYSTFNINLLKTRQNIDAIHFVAGFNETIPMKDILFNQYVYDEKDKDIDVLFLGYVDSYPRRIVIKQQFIFCKVSMWFVSDLDIEGMRKAIRRAKVCINMAAKDPFVLATVRMNILLSNQACIVSETSCDDYANELYAKSGMVFVPYNLIVAKTLQLIRSPEERKKIAVKSYQWYRKRRWTDLFDFNKHLPEIV